MADVGFVAACTDLIVIGQIEIEDKLFSYRSKCCGFAKRLAVSWIGGVNRTYFETRGIQLENLFS